MELYQKPYFTLFSQICNTIESLEAILANKFPTGICAKYLAGTSLELEKSPTTNRGVFDFQSAFLIFFKKMLDKRKKMWYSVKRCVPQREYRILKTAGGICRKSSRGIALSRMILPHSLSNGGFF